MVDFGFALDSNNLALPASEGSGFGKYSEARNGVMQKNTTTPSAKRAFWPSQSAQSVKLEFQSQLKSVEHSLSLWGLFPTPSQQLTIRISECVLSRSTSGHVRSLLPSFSRQPTNYSTWSPAEKAMALFLLPAQQSESPCRCRVQDNVLISSCFERSCQALYLLANVLPDPENGSRSSSAKEVVSHINLSRWI